MSFADTVEEIDGIYYSLSDDGTATVVQQTTYNSTMDGVEVVIPEMVTSQERDEYTVTALANNAFRNTGIISIVLPSTITSIGTYAFYGCTSLTSVDFSATHITTLPNYCFHDCVVLTDVKLPATETLTTIGNYCFDTCSALETITVPEGVTTINLQAFVDCTTLSIVSLPSTLTSIGNNAFQHDTNIILVCCKAETPPSLYYSFPDGLDATLCVPAGSVSAYAGNEDWSGYFIDITSGCDCENGDVTEYEIIFDPEPGKVPYIDVIDATCSDGISLAVDDDYDGIIVTNISTGEQVSASFILDEVDDTTCRINFDPAVRDDGTYNVHIPAGVFWLGEKTATNGIYDLTYTIGNGNNGKYGLDWTPKDSVVYLYEIEFSCPNGFDANHEADTFIVYDAEGNEVTAGSSFTEGEEIHNGWFSTLTLVLETPVNTEGNYTLSVPDKAFLFYTGGEDDVYSEGFDIAYYVTGGEAPEPSTEYLELITYPEAGQGITGPLTTITVSTENKSGLL
ncbi:MAG: leucine-rich repeat domain-containing protein, partial [Clostridia bacterium]|nr:leucine-rich repeat domain-containing protein [Clostridia bacterium]